MVREEQESCGKPGTLFLHDIPSSSAPEDSCDRNSVIVRVRWRLISADQDWWRDAPTVCIDGCLR